MARPTARPLSDHWDGERFFNPGEPSPDRTLGDGLRWKMQGAPMPWPPSVPIVPAKPEARVERLRITMVGHASLLIQAAGRNILTDPVWSRRASPVPFAGPARVTGPGIAFADLPAIDAVVLSHSHYDHCDLDTLRRLHARDAPMIAVPLGLDAVVRAAVPDARLQVGDWHERLVLGENLATVLTPAIHWSARSLFDRRRTLWCGHFLEVGDASVWFAGDTAYGDGHLFGEIRRRYGVPQVALIPIGAYEPRWFMAAAHVAPFEAVKIFQDVGAGHALGIHWGTFPLSDEGREAPRRDLAAALEAAGVAPARFVAAEAGGVYGFGGTAAPLS